MSAAAGTLPCPAARKEFAADDATVQDIVVVGDLRVSGTDRRITWPAKARDGSSVVVTIEPMENGTASLVVQQMGLATLELDEEARERSTSRRQPLPVEG